MAEEILTGNHSLLKANGTSLGILSINTAFLTMWSIRIVTSLMYDISCFTFAFTTFHKYGDLHS